MPTSNLILWWEKLLGYSTFTFVNTDRYKPGDQYKPTYHTSQRPWIVVRILDHTRYVMRPKLLWLPALKRLKVPSLFFDAIWHGLGLSIGLIPLLLLASWVF